APLTHRSDEGLVSSNAAAKHNTLAVELPHCAPSLLDERLDERILKREGNRCPRRRGERLGRRRLAHGVQHRCFQSTERHVVVVSVAGPLITPQHRTRGTKMVDNTFGSSVSHLAVD